ncbi:MAG: polyprenol monophosphomannose synthase [Candidatus Delongbacteria bacterium]|nr:polyprenol monophosphomannose synthase [Candidatus Delongbacteria bacterium]
MSDRALVIIPTYNECANAELIINRVLAQSPIIDVLIVDDNSPDGTGKLVDQLVAANERVHVIHREGKLGLGTAYVAGFKYAIERQYDYVFEMDADLSHDPQEIPNFLEAIRENDLVIGSRYIQGVNVINWPLSRLLLSKGASLYTRIITGMPIKDPTGGFKCFRRPVLEALDLDRIKSGGYSFQIEVNFKVWKKGLRIREIPIIFTDRMVGSSKMSRQIVREAVVMVWRLKLRSLLGRL